MPWAPPTAASYRIEVRGRAGGRLAGCSLTEGDIQAEFTRTTDTVSEASVRVNAARVLDGCATCRPTPWDDELVFWRDNNPQPAWIGPVVSVSDEAGDLIIRAQDRMGNLGDRDAADDHPALRAGETPTVEPLQLVRWIVEQAGRRQSLGLAVVGYPTAAAGLVTAAVAAGDRLEPVLRALAENDIDWTVVGPTLHVGVPTVALPALPALSVSRHWTGGGEGASLELSGVAQASHVVVQAAGGLRVVYPAGPPVAGTYRPLYALREEMTSRAEAERLARDLWADAQEPAVTISTGSSSLSIDAPLAVEDLIPGRVITVHYDVGVLEAAQAQRLTGVTVTIGATVAGRSWDLAEQAVAVELQPVKRRVAGDAGLRAADARFAAGDAA